MNASEGPPVETFAVERLLPTPGQTTIGSAVAGLDFADAAPTERPYVLINFATTLDGRATIEGRAGGIGGEADQELLRMLRTRVDAVMVGAGTLRAERYGRIIRDPSLRAWRERVGLAHDPLAVVFSESFRVPWDIPLFTDGGGRVVVFTSSDDEAPETATQVTVVRHPDGVHLGRALAYLREERGIRSALCEGGPTLHGDLWRAGLVDELFLTIAPKLVGERGPGILHGILEEAQQLELASLMTREGELFSRYMVAEPKD